MNESASATIIPFPVRPRLDPPGVPSVSHAPARSTEHQSESLRSLSSALTEQRDALQRWREALSDLSAKMQTIGGGSGR